MAIERKPLYVIEAVIFPLVVGIVNLFFPDKPGFAGMQFLPYLVPPLFMAAYAGLGFGFLSFGVGAVLLFGPFPFAAFLLYGTAPGPAYWRTLLPAASIPFAVAIVLLYSFGLIQKYFAHSLSALKERFRNTIKSQHMVQKKAKILERVNVELDERLSRQQESITALYNQLKGIDTLSVANTLTSLLETVQIFTKATKASIWQYWQPNNSMKLAAQSGWLAEDRLKTEIPLEGTLEGWTYRNNQLFSVRMLLQYENLQKMDKGRNIIILPINIKKKSWGILSIEELPFEKYNLYTERVLYIIISLLEPALDRSIEHETFIEKEEKDSESGLPLFSSFFRFFEKEMERMELQKGTLCVVILEIANYDDLTGEYGERETAAIHQQLIPAIEGLTGNFAEIFHYKTRNQLGIIIPNLDYDGASLFCLEILEKINSGDWRIAGNPVNLEVLVGYSAYSGTQTLDEMLTSAELLLEIQKL
ncbi:MAG: hypothetical protein E4H36_07910 [Spirochaetales bacterium]|nr:MAG: hypothetical protein E4H36_07910 [Spirochaetales bacterium]